MCTSVIDLLVTNVMNFLLSKFKESSQIMYHLFMTVKIWFHDSTRQLTSFSIIYYYHLQKGKVYRLS